ncbi:helix-turn-helix domain-containing protein [Fructilactobacillus hinvesii]|uniref:Helix-turn-helix domain-containing protein n=1 Tax=Fructilactobacillus hinvesii TaxID=2940300 RepID=A0ABY5BSY1_9LACO|nr:helix-turn-helix transcriptional regulator [Fructilactobacillus hinvesii]USS88238.1 helix-turn-helix domain-containing protein [Fructilactobacillus hinvesii]
MNLSKKIKKARTDLNLTQSEVAKKLNISRKTLSSWENERSNPDPDSLKQLSSILKIDINELLNIEKQDHKSQKSSKKFHFGQVLFGLNALTLLINCLVSLFTSSNYFGLTLMELILVIFTLHYFKIKNIKLTIPYEGLSILVTFIVSIIISWYHLDSLNNGLNVFNITGMLTKSIILTICFYFILVYLYND